MENMKVSDPAAQAGTSHMLPHANKLTLDSSLKYNNKNFIQELKEGTILENGGKERQLDSVVPFPEPKVLAHFASKAYLDQEDNETREEFEKKLQLSAGWRLLTTANNLALLGTIRGYFGAVFWHPIFRQIVIAHRGTIPKNLDALRADGWGIFGNQYVKQMNAACSFTQQIYEGVKDCEKALNTNFEIYFTGHSLGAWLAQITTYSLKYLTLEKETFLKNPNPKGGRHAHTEVFDSPGCRDMLLKMESDFNVRYSGETSVLDNLDVTIYLSSPNFVNCCNLHVGRLYRVYPKIASDTYLMYTQSSHSMDGILKTFNASDPLEIMEVVDWPKIEVKLWHWKIWKVPKSILGKEYEDFFEWAKGSRYEPKPENVKFKVTLSSHSENQSLEDEFVMIRYQTKAARLNECRLSVFTESEKAFLRKFQLLRILPNSVFDGDQITDDLRNKIKNKLLQLKLSDESVSCEENRNISQLISYVKTLLRHYPNLIPRVERALTDFQVRKQIYLEITDSYLLKMEALTRMILKPEWPTLVNFLNGQNQVCRISDQIGTDFAAAKALKIILADIKGLRFFAFELQSLLNTETFFHLTEFLNSGELIGNCILLVECKKGSFQSFSSLENEALLRKVINRVREKSGYKLILIFDKNESLILNNDLDLINEGITWNELTTETKKMIVTKKVVIFQGERNKCSLENLFRRTITEDDFNQLADIIDSETLAKFVRDEDVIVGGSVFRRTINDEVLNQPADIIDRETEANIVADENATVGGSASIRPDIYVTRKFTYPRVKDTVFNDIIQDDNCVAVISGLNEKDLDNDNSFPTNSRTKLIDGIKKGKIKLITSDDQDFDSLCSKYPAKDVHWLKYCSNSFIFHKTRSSLELIRKHIDDQVVEYTEETFLDTVRGRKTVIISDAPGMGKSTVLSVLAEKMKAAFPGHWVVRVNLNDCAEVLKNAIFDEKQFKNGTDAARFVLNEILPCSKSSELSSDFEKRLFEKALITHGGIVLIFDGFDEISPNYERTVTQLLQYLQETKVENILVTTRPHTKKQLEEHLLTLSHALVPFSDADRKKYLIEILNKSFNGVVAIEDLERYAQELKISIRDREKSFLGIPLHCTLLADYVVEKGIIKDENQALDDLSLVDLYENFIERKINIYNEEKTVKAKGNIGAVNQKEINNILMRKMHWQYALKLILSDDNWHELDYPEIEDEFKQFTDIEVLKVGLVTNTGNKPQFLHRTFAEFFVLDYTLSLARNVKKNSKKLNILSRNILLKREFNVIRTFLDSLIQNAIRTAETENVLRSFVEVCSQNQPTSPDDCHYENEGIIVLHTLLEERLEFTFTLFFPLMEQICPTAIPIFLSNADDGPALHIAVRNGNSNIVRLISKNITDINSPVQNLINARDGRGWTALNLASHLGLTPLVSILLENGAHIEARALSEFFSNLYDLDEFECIDSGFTPLIIASYNGYIEVVELLLEKGAYINACSTNNGLTPLIAASGNGYLELVRLLLEKGANINAENKHGSSALIAAASEGQHEIVRLLLENGANVNAKNYDRSTALEKASKRHLETSDILGKNPSRAYIGIVSLLIKKGANIEARNKQGSTVLIEASYYGNLELVLLLLENGADIDASDNNGLTALTKATSEMHLEVVQLLLKKGAGENKRFTALIKASSEGHLGIVQLLLEKGAKIDAQDDNRLTALIKAASEADINAIDILERTSLIMAFPKGNLEVVRLLLDNGAYIKEKDKLPLLNSALKNGHLEVVRLLLENGADIKASEYLSTVPLVKASFEGHLEVEKYGDLNDNDILVSLFMALYYGHLEVVRLLLENFADINGSDKHGLTPLMIASSKGHLEIARYLLEKGANINVSDKYGSTALIKASSDGSLEVVSLLLENGANFNVGDEHGFTPLTKASSKGHLEVVSLLLQKGANINVGDKHGFTPLMKASYEGNLEVARHLLEKGANINVGDKHGFALLMNASSKGHLELVLLLLEKGVDIKGRNNNGLTPLMKAASEGQLEVIQLLLEKGADVNARDKEESTALMHACSGGYLEVVRLLFKKGAAINASDINGSTALIKAAFEGRLEAVHLLLEGGANINASDKYGSTALIKASSEGHLEIARHLLGGGADFNVSDKHGFTPLMKASSKGHLEVVRLLLEKGAEINPRNYPGSSALIKASSLGHVEVVRLLLESCEEFNASEYPGSTALFQASSGGHLEVVRLLREKCKLI